MTDGNGEDRREKRKSKALNLSDIWPIDEPVSVASHKVADCDRQGCTVEQLHQSDDPQRWGNA